MHFCFLNLRKFDQFQYYFYFKVAIVSVPLENLKVKNHSHKTEKLVTKSVQKYAKIDLMFQQFDLNCTLSLSLCIYKAYIYKKDVLVLDFFFLYQYQYQTSSRLVLNLGNYFTSKLERFNFKYRVVHTFQYCIYDTLIHLKSLVASTRIYLIF